LAAEKHDPANRPEVGAKPEVGTKPEVAVEPEPRKWIAGKVDVIDEADTDDDTFGMEALQLVRPILMSLRLGRKVLGENCIFGKISSKMNMKTKLNPKKLQTKIYLPISSTFLEFK
jgi:hypothetical protein